MVTIIGYRHLAIVAFGLLLAGCGGTSASSIAPPAGQSVVPFESRAVAPANEAKTRDRLYVSDTLLNEILVFRASERAQNPPPLATIQVNAQPQGLWVDQGGLLYAVVGASVEEFKPGEKTPFLTITNGPTKPVSVAVDASLTVYVSDEEQKVLKILEYPAGSTSPSLTVSLTIPGTVFAFSGGMTFDNAGNLYVAVFFYPKSAHVYRIAPGSTTATDVGLVGVGNEAGLGSDTAGNLYVGSDQGDINVYAPGHKTPGRVIQFSSTGPSLFAVTRAGALYVPQQSRQGGAVLEFAPNGNSPVNVLSGPYFSQPFGAALEKESF